MTQTEKILKEFKEEFTEAVVEELGFDIIDKPAVVPVRSEPYGWSVGCGLIGQEGDLDSPWWNLRELIMENSNWDIPDIYAGIIGMRELLAELEQWYNKNKLPEDPTV